MSPTISLVIPGRDCAATLDKCLDSVSPLMTSGALCEIIFVDDGSRDASANIAEAHGVRVLRGNGGGPGYARNLGWRAARGDWIWFIDSDCVAEPDALERLRGHFDDEVGAVGGSYANLFPDSLVASLIHEEIVARHRRMPRDVNFLATFNVVYRREILERLAGFDESLKLAQDADLAFRARDAGYRLRFEILSKVGHHHPVSLSRYLRTQARQGFYRMWLYRSHPRRARGDHYADWTDFAQPPLAALLSGFLLLSMLALGVGWLGESNGMQLGMIAGGLAVWGILLLAILQLPIAIRIASVNGLKLGGCFVPFGMIRAFARAQGAIQGVLATVRAHRWSNARSLVRTYNATPTIRSPRKLLFDMASDLWGSRGLAWQLLVRDLRAQYRESLLGYFWLVLPPLATTLIWCWLRSSGLVTAPSEDVPYALYVLVGFVMWDAFVGGLQSPLQAIRDAAPLLARLAFPREAVFLASLGQVVFQLVIRCVLLSAAYAWFGVTPPWTSLYALPCLAALLLLGFVLGLALTPFALLTTDISRGMTFLTGFWFFLTPVVYRPPIEGLAAAMMRWNPVAPLVTFARDAATTGDMTWLGAASQVVSLTFVGVCVAWVFCRLALPHAIARLGG